MPDDRRDRWQREDERDLLRRSLEDAKAEFEAGDLDQQSFDAISQRDQSQLDALNLELHAISEESEPLLSGRYRSGAPNLDPNGDDDQELPARRSRILLYLGLLCLVFGAVVLVVSLSSHRLPGQVGSGTVTLTATGRLTQELSQAATLANENKLATALTLYATVLAQDPKQPEALAETGWLDYQSGLKVHIRAIENKGIAQIKKAVKADPRFYASHLFLGNVDYNEQKDAKALRQYKLFLNDSPTASWLEQARPDIVALYSKLGLQLPSQYQAGT